MSHDGRAALSCGAVGLSVVCNCSISLSYSLTIFGLRVDIVKECSGIADG